MFNIWIDKKRYYYIKISYNFKPDSYSINKIKVELDFSNHATESEVKKATGVNTSNFAKKVDLASLISELDELDVAKLKAENLNNLCDVVKNDVVKKCIL